MSQIFSEKNNNKLIYVLTHTFFMVNMTLAVPKELHNRMKQFSYVRWSEIARHAFEKQVTLLEKAETLVKDSTLSEEDAELLAQAVNKAATQQFVNENSSGRRKHPFLSTHKKEQNTRTPLTKK